MSHARQYNTELAGEKFEVWTYGGCYLGRHMNALADIQRGVVEKELLAEAIPELLTSGPDTQAVALVATKSASDMTSIVHALTEMLHTPDNFGIDANGELADHRQRRGCAGAVSPTCSFPSMGEG